MYSHKDPWPPYEFPRNIQNLDIPWADSFEGDSPLGSGADVHDIVYPVAPKRNGLLSGSPARNLFAVLRCLRRIICEWSCAIFADCATHESTRVSLSGWRAFGVHSRPTVNGVSVHNTFTPSPTPYRNIDLDEVDLDEVFASLRSPGGTLHPELWIRGIAHPSLPPEPPEWHVPVPGEPLTFPWDCQINPFLEHAICGPAPVYWNIRTGWLAILYGGPLNITIPLSPADLSQPATRPLLSHMYVSAVALADARFPWKFMIGNPKGIRVRDIFGAIMDNFRQFVWRAEFHKWSLERQQRASLEWRLREKGNDGMRRIDYLAGSLYFRGIAPNPDRTGWVLYVGGEW
ncbi:hypothetical protein DFH09DRAFT_1286528 [Mycena vulgaris]|nr:hypothetical protein DFH09DRAFT_1286528 [Mycena vulgaris]